MLSAETTKNEKQDVYNACIKTSKALVKTLKNNSISDDEKRQELALIIDVLKHNQKILKTITEKEFREVSYGTTKENK